MTQYNRISIIIMIGITVLVGLFGISKGAFGSSDRAMLQDINVLTLYHGRMTSARRSSPIPQLKCVGGTAGCDAFTPQVVQCYNRGSDGYDVQWECKTDMDNAYRFGKVEVSCEGYDYPDDPYVLKGSCGLEYTIDLTKEGYEKQQSSGHSYYKDQQNSYSTYSPSTHKKGSIFGDLLTLGVIAVVIYVIYVTCLSGNSGRQDTNTRRPDSYPRSSPPPPGFRDEYMPGGGCSSSSSSYDNYSNDYGTRRNTQNAGTGGGFWSGAATGGILGYLFGSRTNTGYHRQPYGRTGWGNSWGGWGNGGWGGNSWGNGGWGSSRGFTGSSGWGSSGRSSSSSGGGSTGTRTASGFGGTKRR